ncbi:calcium-binding protein [Microcystis wesenbergii FACHB-1317]|uniref:beta strand repeat-containing protein n=1 Tax=Microcystis wesenbergii TaxID=44823 RepID=UPI001681351A|nr:Ig-like domain-containing protein [Microcystis wesenbergii]MBD2291897.1 calcium-binding protein [Microcystis wesenbergii FACHB-1317]
MALQEGTYTWEYGDTTQALWFTASYNTVTNQWTVDMKKGSMDLNALWWSNGDSNADGNIVLSKADNSLNMNGTGIVWDGYDKISDTGLTGTEHNGSSLLTAGNTYTYSYSKDQGVEIESLLAQGVVTLGVRATSVNGTDGIKAVDGQFVFVPYDTTPPTVTVNIVDTSLNDGDNNSLVTFQFSETVSGFTVDDVTPTNGTLSNFTQVDGSSYQATFTATDGVETTGSVSVAANSYTDIAGNNGGAGSDTVTIDTKNPTLAVNIVDTSLNDGDNNSLVTFQFSETVSGFTVGDVSVSGGTLSNFTQVDGNSYTATFTADDAVETTGSVSVAAASYTDVAGNTGGAGTDTVTIDTLNPTLAVDIVDTSLNDGDNSSLVTFEFSEDVNGFTVGDVSVIGGTLSNFTQVDGNSYTAIFTADDAVETTGSVSVAADSYSDIAGNNGGAGTDTVTIDTLNPTLALDIVNASLNDGTNSSLVSFEFSEDVTGFDNSDVNVSGGTLSNFTQVDGNSYTAIFTADDAVETTGSVSVAADSYSDVAGNTGGAGTDTVTIDTLNPTVGITFDNSPLTSQNFSTTVTFQFSETVSGFTASDVTLTKGVLSNFTSVNGDTYTATFTPTDFQSPTGTVAVSNGYFDTAGNQGAANSATIAMTVGGGPDPNDGPSGGSIVIGSGTAGADSITGSTGNDNLSGLDGNDTINGGDGNDTINGGTGADIIRGGTGNDNIIGLGGFDLIYGGSGNDTINGGNGIDTIVGGFGNDSLTGGGGDTFRFLSIYDQQDVITGFNDTIVFDITGASAFTALGNGALGTTTYTGAIAGGYLTYSGGVLSYDADGSAGSTFSPLAIVTLTGSPTLTNSNVLFQNL